MGAAPRLRAAPREAFAGIDVAVARSKRLPVCVCVRDGGALVPLPLTRAGVRPPPGIGNVAALDIAATAAFAAAAGAYLRDVERLFGVAIGRVAIDAPRGPAPDGGRRLGEVALGARGIRYFVTPDAAGWERVRTRVRRHLDDGGETGGLPHANQLWMLAGFALFAELQRDRECLEVFPHAIALTLGAAGQRKLSPGGLDARVAAVAARTRWPVTPDAAALDAVAFGARHDKLDAYLCAWVASLREDEREALGGPPDDAIWLPVPAAPTCR